MRLLKTGKLKISSPKICNSVKKGWIICEQKTNIWIFPKLMWVLQTVCQASKPFYPTIQVSIKSDYFNNFYNYKKLFDKFTYTIISLILVQQARNVLQSSFLWTLYHHEFLHKSDTYLWISSKFLQNSSLNFSKMNDFKNQKVRNFTNFIKSSIPSNDKG